MNLNDDKKQPLRSYPLESKKKMLIMQYKGASQVKETSKFDTPQDYISYLDNYSKADTLNPVKLFNCVESLRIALTSNTLSWVHDFGNRGLTMIFNILDLSTRLYAYHFF